MCKKQELGRLGETFATKYLLKNGYNVIERNFFCKQGEIDIIANIKNELVFIEVKTRTSILFGRPAEAVTQIKRKHMQKAAQYYIHKNRLENKFIRFDIIEVYIQKK